jgi:hypothetical protein
VTHRSGTSRSRSFPDNRGDYSRLRAAVARCLMSEPVVRALEPVTHRTVPLRSLSCIAAEHGMREFDLLGHRGRRSELHPRHRGLRP